MKKFLLLVSLLLVVPNVAMGAESTAPKPNAAPSKWLSWFRGVPHLTMDHLAKARAYMHSKWRCMARGEGCSKRQRNALRVLSAAIVGAAVRAGFAVKSRVNRNKRAAAAKAFRTAVTAAADAFRDAAAADAAWQAAAAAWQAAAADAFRDAAAAVEAVAAADAATAAKAATDAAWQAAAKAFRDAAAADAAWQAAAWDAWDTDPTRAEALEALAAAGRDPSAVNLNAVADAIKKMDAQ